MMWAALSVKCGAGYCSTPGAKWRIRRLHNILRKCSAKYFAVRICVTLYSVRSYPADYYFAAEQASDFGPVQGRGSLPYL